MVLGEDQEVGFELIGSVEEMVNLTLFKLPSSQELGVDCELRARKGCSELREGDQG